MVIFKTSNTVKGLTTVSFLVMVVVNALANTLPINGIGTGEVSDNYKNFFAPAGITFSIWGLIYIVLAGYTLYQLGFFHDKGLFRNNAELFDKIGLYFTLSSIANTVWIFSWHYDIIALSLVLMIMILICLILIADEINKSNLSSLRDKIFIKIPFSIYFGWITVATIANATTFFVSIGWRGFGISEVTWTVVIVIIGVIISIATMLKYKDVVFGLVVIWAYTGIFIKHIATNGFTGKYPGIITTVVICIILLLITIFYILYSNKKLKALKIQV